MGANVPPFPEFAWGYDPARRVSRQHPFQERHPASPSCAWRYTARSSCRFPRTDCSFLSPFRGRRFDPAGFHQNPRLPARARMQADRGGDYPQGPEALLNAISQIHNIFLPWERRGRGLQYLFQQSSPIPQAMRPASVLAAFTVICWPSMALTAVSNGSKLPELCVHIRTGRVVSHSSHAAFHERHRARSKDRTNAECGIKRAVKRKSGSRLWWQ